MVSKVPLLHWDGNVSSRTVEVALLCSKKRFRDDNESIRKIDHYCSEKRTGLRQVFKKPVGCCPSQLSEKDSARG